MLLRVSPVNIICDVNVENNGELLWSNTSLECWNIQKIDLKYDLP